MSEYGFLGTENGDLIHALGTLGYDFGTEARHDAFKHSMAAAGAGAKPADALAMAEYLGSHAYEAPRLIWTLSVDLVPTYAIVAAGPFAREAYEAIRQLLEGRSRAAEDPLYAERVGVSGRLTGETVRLLSGQVVPQVAIASPHGLYGWSLAQLADKLAAATRNDRPDADETAVQKSARSVEERISLDLYGVRNSGHSAQDRALTFAVTHLVQASSAFSEAVSEGLSLASFGLERSDVPRMNSDCWDAVLRFFDPQNEPQGQKEYRFTIDVSDVLPVLLSPLKSASPTGLVMATSMPSAPAVSVGAAQPSSATSSSSTTATGTSDTTTPSATDTAPRVQILARGADSPDNLDGAAYHFGTQTLGTPARVRVFCIENTLDRALELDGMPRVALAGSGADQFEVLREPTSPVPAGGKTTFTICFAPTSAGTKEAHASIACDAPGRPPLVIPLMGTAEALPSAAICVKGELLEDGIHWFGAAQIGSQKAATFTLENPTSSMLTLMGDVVLDGQGEHFNVSTPPPSTIDAGGSATFAVTFNPLNAGTKLAMGCIEHDGEGSPATFVLVGRADGVEIALKQGASDIPTSGLHDFGEIRLESPTSTVTFTIENQGAEPLLLTGTPPVVVVGTDAADFTIATQPTSPVLPGESTPFSVTFAPRGPGQKQAEVKIPSNDPDENPYVVKLTGLSRCLDASRGKRDRITSNEYFVVYCDNKGVVRYRNLHDTQPWREVLELTDVTIVKTGQSGMPSYAVKSDGTVWSWNYSGNAALAPKQIPNITDVIGMDVGNGFALFLKSDGTVWSIGQNNVGQLGIGNTSSTSQVMKVSSLSNVVAVAAGYDASFALLSDGTVQSWGANTDGMLGNGLGSNTSVPQPIPGLTRIVDIAAYQHGYRYALALRDDGVLWGWGHNAYGGLATSVPAPRNFPVQITGIPKLRSILFMYRGNHGVCVVAEDGKLWSWGYDSYSRLGRTGSATTPTPISSAPTDVLAGCGLNQAAVVIDGKGNAWTWGTTTWGGTSATAKLMPDLVL